MVSVAFTYSYSQAPSWIYENSQASALGASSGSYATCQVSDLTLLLVLFSSFIAQLICTFRNQPMTSKRTHLEQKRGHEPLALHLTCIELHEVVVAFLPRVVHGSAHLDAHREAHGLHPTQYRVVNMAALRGSSRFALSTTTEKSLLK